MHVIEPVRYQPKPVRRKRWPFVVVPVVLLLAIGAANYLRPLPAPVAQWNISVPATGPSPSITWPGEGQAAIAADGYGLLGTSGNIKPIATASTTKVITALCVLQKQPLALGQAGPTYTISKSDVDIYQRYADQNGSLVPVTEGEHLTEYQALEALMIPSANNIADSLVRWVFGSQDAYAAYAADFLQQHGLTQTHVGKDASGFDASTASTATDLTDLGLLALKNPVLMQIAGKASTELPVAGTVTNYDTVLGVNGINGLKTGNSDDDPGAFIFTSTAQAGGKTIPITGAVMGAPDLDTALQASTKLAASMRQSFESATVSKAGQAVGAMHTAWGATEAIVPSNDLALVRWKGTAISEKHQLDAGKRTDTIGTLKITAGRAEASSPLKLAQPLAAPSFWWRLTRH